MDPQKNDRSPKEQPPINKPDPGSQISPEPQRRSQSQQAPSAPQKADESTPSEHTFKPLRIAYTAKRSVVWLALFAFVGIIILITAEQGVNPLVLLVIVALLALGAGADITVSYRKERYRFSSAAILYNTGNVFTDKETELRYKNITHVRLIKPFIEYRLFGTGHILIEAAGSSGTEVEVRSVADPEAIYTQLQSVMSSNGFSLKYGRLLEQAQPARLAVILEMFGMLTGAAVTLLAVIAPGIIELFGNITALPQPLVATVASIGGLLVIGGGGFFLYATYQDFMRRTYYVYDDVIAYTRGFLTKQKAFIPVENLSDSTLTQTIIDKLLNLYDVVISCQGGGSEISFRNLRQGKRIEETIDQLINEQTTSSKTEPSDHEQPQHAPQTTAAATTPKQIDATQASFKMNTVRTLVPHLLLLPLFILFPPLVLAPIYNYIVVRRTEFRLTKSGVASYFTFLNTKNIEFSSDKITAVSIRRSLIDRWFNTCSVAFWSIGSTSAVVFKHIDDYDGLDQLMAGKAGIHNEQELDRLQPQAYLGNLFAAHLGTAITAGILILSSWLLVVLSWWGLIVAITLIFAAGLLVLTLRRRYRRALLSYRQHSLTYRYGWFIKHSYYVLYDSIKDAAITAYPWTQFGTIRFNIAGEQAQSDQKSKPNHITARYLPNRPEYTHFHNHIFDQLLLRRPNPQQYQQLLAAPPTQTVIHQSGPSLKNALGAANLWFLGVFIVLFLTIASIFPEPSNQQGLVGLLIILAIVIIVSLLVRLWVRRISYIIEDNRTLRRSGVIYRTQTSIIYPKLDYIKHGQGFANKLFRNGNLYLYTTGSQAAELTFKNAPDYQELHRQLKAYYET